jgi:Na+/H+-dicarboxylate symporter
MATIDYQSPPPPPAPETAGRFNFFRWWASVPLYARIVGGMILGLFVGLILGERAHWLDEPAKLIIRLLGAIAPPLILVAVVHALIHAQVKAGVAGRLFFLLILNTVVAILIGLLVANVVKPGRWAKKEQATTQPSKVKTDNVGNMFLDQVPTSVVKPLVDNNVIGVIIVAVAFGIALRRLKAKRDITPVTNVIEIAFDAIVVVLHWIIAIVPLAVFGIVANIVGTKGFGPFVKLGGFVVAVLVALLLQSVYYLTRIGLGCWASPWRVLKGMRDALVMAFSTGSSTATMPVTYDRLMTRVGLREESASLGSLVGANFNNDGTALYEAMSALFIAQLLGMHLTLTQQFVVVIMSVVASVGAAGIPEAGLVTMTLVFRAVGLPPEYIAFLIPVDWFLDRCRTAINVLGDVNVSCMLEGKQRGSLPVAAPAEVVVVVATSPADTGSTSS